MDAKGTAMLSVRISKDTKDLIPNIAQAMSRRIGAKISQTQAVEIALSEAARRYLDGVDT